jgi:hypothetical protein
MYTTYRHLSATASEPDHNIRCGPLPKTNKIKYGGPTMHETKFCLVKKKKNWTHCVCDWYPLRHKSELK